MAISIHALLAESDRCQHQPKGLYQISIHALLAESDVCMLAMAGVAEISIHALLAESDRLRVIFHIKNYISIHALLAESDRFIQRTCLMLVQFLSTLSLRRATMRAVGVVAHTVISIHALLAESDSRSPSTFQPFWYFYPRSPCGERPFHPGPALLFAVFLSTLSLRRATVWDV